MPKLDQTIFNEEVVELLRKNKIFSVNDFLAADFDKKVLASKLTEEEILEAIHKLISNFSAPPKNGLKLYQYLLRKTNIIPTFIKGLDELLNGGLLTGSIVEICGLSGSGKTQICLSITINIAINMRSNVTYIDTKRDFYSKRLLQILRKRNLTEESDEILERINIVLVNDIYNLITILHSIANNACLPNNKNIGQLIILDSLAALFFPFIGLTSNEGLSLLNHIASLLKMIAVRQHVTIVLTNLGSKYEETIFDTFKLKDIQNENEEEKIDSDIKPSLGKYWLHVPNTRFIINRVNTTDSLRILTVHKSDYIKLGNKCIVNVFDEGVS